MTKRYSSRYHKLEDIDGEQSRKRFAKKVKNDSWWLFAVKLPTNCRVESFTPSKILPLSFSFA